MSLKYFALNISDFILITFLYSSNNIDCELEYIMWTILQVVDWVLIYNFNNEINSRYSFSIIKWFTASDYISSKISI